MFDRKISSGDDDMFNNPEGVKRYAEHMNADGTSHKAFFKIMKSLPVSGHLLDVGAGPGRVAAKVALEYPDCRITALEMSPVMTEFAQKHIGEKGLSDRIEYVVGDAADENFISGLGTFDFIYSSYCLHEFDYPESVIRSLLSHLNDGGTLYLFDLRRVWWMYILPFKGGMYDSIRAGLTAGETREIMNRMGIKAFESRSVFPFMHYLVIRK
jgi:ubiquinone/menaquinone biosynthesis C-methylase UbiE